MDNKKNNYFYTRTKFGRWRFDLIMVVGFTIQFSIGIIEGIIWGFPTKFPIEILLANNIFAAFGSYSILLLTEIVSQLNSRLISELTENQIFPESKKFEKKMMDILWSKKVYILAGLLFIFQLISQTALWLVDYEGKLLLTHIINLSVLGWLAPILYAELIWTVLIPILLIFALPFLKDIRIELNVFTSDSAGGLSPIANYLLQISLMITLTESLALYWLSTPDADLWAQIALVTIIILIPLFYFIIPTIGLNRVMRQQKNAVLKELDKKMKEIYMMVSPLQAHEVTKSMQYYLETIRLLQESASAMHEWPFSLSGLRNLLSSFLIPMGIFLFNNIQKIMDLF
ncbi:MAG: hypothetical protein ACXADY_07920 [Candidatus Hodarchaeales archaeon]|jgi:hypothetical protein